MNEPKIWDYLLRETENEIGTAAIMGNLMAESSLNPGCVTGSKDPGYIDKADFGYIDFVYDGCAFGLVQWCYHTRKLGLLNYAQQIVSSVGDLQTQLEYLVIEMSGKYKTVWSAVRNATDLRTVSDIIMLNYEKPAGTSEKAKQKRADYGLKFLNQFSATAQKPAGNQTVEAIASVNLRSGPGKDNPKIGALKKGQALEWLATENGWHKVAVWVSGEFSEVRRE